MGFQAKRIFFLVLFQVFRIDTGAADQREICSVDGGKCQFPYTYEGITYDGECTPTTLNVLFSYWCYTVEDESDWSYCLESCPEEDSSDINATSTPTTLETTTTSTTVTTTTNRSDSPNPSAMRTTTTEASPKSTTSMTVETTTASTRVTTAKSNTHSTTKRTTMIAVTSNTQRSTSTAPSTTTTKKTLPSNSAIVPDSEHTTKLMGGEDPLLEPTDDEAGEEIGTVTVVVIALSVIFFIVFLVVVYLYVKKLRKSRSEGNSDAELEKKEGGSDEGLLRQKSNGKHEKNDEKGQEMSTLMTPHNGAGDCDVLNEKTPMNNETEVSV